LCKFLSTDTDYQTRDAYYQVLGIGITKHESVSGEAALTAAEYDIRVSMQLRRFVRNEDDIRLDMACKVIVDGGLDYYNATEKGRPVITDCALSVGYVRYHLGLTGADVEGLDPVPLGVERLEYGVDGRQEGYEESDCAVCDVQCGQFDRGVWVSGEEITVLTDTFRVQATATSINARIARCIELKQALDPLLGKYTGDPVGTTGPEPVFVWLSTHAGAEAKKPSVPGMDHWPVVVNLAVEDVDGLKEHSIFVAVALGIADRCMHHRCSREWLHRFEATLAACAEVARLGCLHAPPEKGANVKVCRIVRKPEEAAVTAVNADSVTVDYKGQNACCFTPGNIELQTVAGVEIYVDTSTATRHLLRSCFDKYVPDRRGDHVRLSSVRGADIVTPKAAPIEGMVTGFDEPSGTYTVHSNDGNIPTTHRGVGNARIVSTVEHAAESVVEVDVGRLSVVSSDANDGHKPKWERAVVQRSRVKNVVKGPYARNRLMPTGAALLPDAVLAVNAAVIVMPAGDPGTITKVDIRGTGGKHLYYVGHAVRTYDVERSRSGPWKVLHVAVPRLLLRKTSGRGDNVGIDKLTAGASVRMRGGQGMHETATGTISSVNGSGDAATFDVWVESAIVPEMSDVPADSVRSPVSWHQARNVRNRHIVRAMLHLANMFTFALGVVVAGLGDCVFLRTQDRVHTWSARVVPVFDYDNRHKYVGYWSPTVQVLNLAAFLRHTGDGSAFVRMCMHLVHEAAHGCAFGSCNDDTCDHGASFVRRMGTMASCVLTTLQFMGRWPELESAVACIPDHIIAVPTALANGSMLTELWNCRAPFVSAERGEHLHNKEIGSAAQYRAMAVLLPRSHVDTGIVEVLGALRRMSTEMYSDGLSTRVSTDRGTVPHRLVGDLVMFLSVNFSLRDRTHAAPPADLDCLEAAVLLSCVERVQKTERSMRVCVSYSEYTDDPTKDTHHCAVLWLHSGGNGSVSGEYIDQALDPTVPIVADGVVSHFQYARGVVVAQCRKLGVRVVNGQSPRFQPRNNLAVCFDAMLLGELMRRPGRDGMDWEQVWTAFRTHPDFNLRLGDVRGLLLRLMRRWVQRSHPLLIYFADQWERDHTVSHDEWWAVLCATCHWPDRPDELLRDETPCDRVVFRHASCDRPGIKQGLKRPRVSTEKITRKSAPRKQLATKAARCSVPYGDEGSSSSVHL
jgi:hypothetical protein